MIVFSCLKCTRKVTGPDNETIDQIVARVEQHMSECPNATLTFVGLTEYARRRADQLRKNLREYQRDWIMRAF